MPARTACPEVFNVTEDSCTIRAEVRVDGVNDTNASAKSMLKRPTSARRSPRPSRRPPKAARSRSSSSRRPDAEAPTSQRAVPPYCAANEPADLHPRLLLSVRRAAARAVVRRRRSDPRSRGCHHARRPLPAEGGDDRANKAREGRRARGAQGPGAPSSRPGRRCHSHDQKDAKGRDFEPGLRGARSSRCRAPPARTRCCCGSPTGGLHYQLGVGVLPLLDRLNALPTLRVKDLRRAHPRRVPGPARDLRKARTLSGGAGGAASPRWSDLLALVTLHERVGGVPPRTAGTNVTGGPPDPATRPDCLPALLHRAGPRARQPLLVRVLPQRGRAARLPRQRARGAGDQRLDTPRARRQDPRRAQRPRCATLLWASPEDANGYEAWRSLLDARSHPARRGRARAAAAT